MNIDQQPLEKIVISWQFRKHNTVIILKAGTTFQRIMNIIIRNV